MNNKLQQMDGERRQKLIYAIVDEFSKYPYKKASINSIVKKAGISKGLIYHYFEDKQDLYYSTIEHVIRELFTELDKQIDWDESDIFERIKQFITVKAELSDQNPGYYEFVLKTYENEDGSIDLNRIKAISEEFGIPIVEYTQKVFTHNIDFSRFKDPLKVKESIRIIQWTFEGINKSLFEDRDLSDRIFDKEHFLEELNSYSDVLKEAFYT